MKSKLHLKNHVLALCFLLLQTCLISIFAQTTRGAYWSGYNSSFQVFPFEAVETSTDIDSAFLTPNSNMVSVK